jgi:hypothetical protein
MGVFVFGVMRRSVSVSRHPKGVSLQVDHAGLDERTAVSNTYVVNWSNSPLEAPGNSTRCARCVSNCSGSC